MLRTIIFIALIAPNLAYALQSNYGVFTALLKKGSIILSLEKKEPLKKTSRDLIVTAIQVNEDSSKSFLLNSENKPVYITNNINFESLNQVTKLHPKIDPLQIHVDETTQLKFKNDEGEFFSTFISLGLSEGTNALYSSLYNSDSTNISYKSLYLKQYYQSKTFPINIGFGLGYKQGTWKSENSGTLSTSAFYIGPSLFKSFYKTKDSSYNVHLNFFQSLNHQGNLLESQTEFSTLGFRLELEKEFLWGTHPLAIGALYSRTKSTIKSSTENLTSPVETNFEDTYGLTLAYRLNWSL